MEPKDAILKLQTGYWIIPLRAAAVVMGVFGFTCLGVLIVVTAIDNKGALETVALALAILAFSVQLIVFIAQQNLASEQGRRNEELYGSMQGVLAEIREKAAGTQADVRAINERMLGALLSKNLSDVPGGQFDPQQVASQVVREADEVIWPPRRPVPDDRSLIRLLQTYPAEDEVGDTMETLEALTLPHKIFLRGFGEDEITARQPNSVFDPSLPVHQLAAGLVDRGLVEPYPSDQQPHDGPVIGRLTDQGRRVARLLTASGEVPTYLPGLSDIREKLPDHSSRD